MTQAKTTTGHAEDWKKANRSIHVKADKLGITHQGLHDFCAKQWYDFKSMSELSEERQMVLLEWLHKQAKLPIQERQIDLIHTLAKQLGMVDGVDDPGLLDFATKVNERYRPIPHIRVLRGYEGMDVVKGLRDIVRKRSTTEGQI